MGETTIKKAQMINYWQIIHDLIADCEKAKRNGLSLADIRTKLLPVKIQHFLKKPVDFLDWIREDREFSLFYFDAQQSGVCAKPAEIVAVILEMIILDALEDAPA